MAPPFNNQARHRAHNRPASGRPGATGCERAWRASATRASA